MQLASIGSSQIDGSGITRPQYIGDMYEGLAGGLLSIQFPDGLNLQLVEGLLIGDNGKQSDQKDWVLVIGDVEKLPFCDHYLIPLWQAVAVFEIKKSFTPADLVEYFIKLSRINELYDTFPARLGALQSSISRCRGYRPDYETDPFGFGEPEARLRRSILEDLSLPLRIGIGFHGPKRWKTFRRHCLDALDMEEASADFHPMPTLVINGAHALVKTIGAPYVVPSDDELMFSYATNHQDPWVFLAKILWWRLIEDHGYQWPVYADDDTPEELLPLTVIVVPDEITGKVELGDSIMPGLPTDSAQPFPITLEAYSLIMMCNTLDQHWYPEEDPELVSAFSDGGKTLSEITEELIATGLYRRGQREGGRIVYQVPTDMVAWCQNKAMFVCDNTFNRALRAQVAENARKNPGKSLHLFAHEGRFVGAYEYELGGEEPGRKFEHIRLAMQFDAVERLRNGKDGTESA